MSPFDLLSELITEILPADVQPIPSIIFCDHDQNEHFQRFSGLARVRERLECVHERTGIRPSILMLGLFSVSSGAGRKKKEFLTLLQWPGIAYLRYGFTREELIAAARRAVEGAKTPLPAELLRKVDELVRDDLTWLVRDLQHWLKTRLNSTEGALKGFRKAAGGVVQLDPSHLEALAAISEKHQDMLDRLWKREAEIQRFVPQSGGLAAMQVAIDQFRERWERLEAVRAALRSHSGRNRKALLHDAVQELEAVREPLARAFDVVAGLRRELATDE